MIEKNVGEFVRLFVLTLVGFILMFVLQPMIYSSGILRLAGIINRGLWLTAKYMPAATIVFVVSILATIIWYVWNSYSPPSDSRASAARSLGWWLLLLLPIVAIVAALAWAAISPPPVGIMLGLDLPILGLMFGFDVLLLYWATTASSTPGLARRLPPGARLFGR